MLIVGTRHKVRHKLQDINQSILHSYKMATLHMLMFLAVILLEGAFGVTDEEFQVCFIVF